MSMAKQTAQFCIGGSAYVGLELLYRRRSHVSMFGAGGVCYLLLGKLPKLPLAARALAGAGLITGVELAAGLLFNRRHQVWDYRDQPGNFMGQICPMFTVLWIPLGLAGSAMYRWTDGILADLSQKSGPTS